MNLRQLKTKIRSIQNVGQITKAMQLVSAVKMKKAQQKAIAGKPYRDALKQTIANIAQSASLSANPLAIADKKAKRELVIIISSNKGLCGVFNYNLLKHIHAVVQNNTDNFDSIVVGQKAQQFLVRYGVSIIADFSRDIPFESNVSALFRMARKEFLLGRYARVSILYNRFISSLVYEPTREVLLPLSEVAVPANTPEKDEVRDYVIEPELNEVLESIFNFYIEYKIRGAIYESEASEHSARMIAMKNATDNAHELVHDMTLLRNSLRQERITNELLDMNTARLAVS